MGKIVITGGNLSNKGAQSMLFITVSELGNRFPNKEIVVFSSMDAKKKDIYEKIYSFQIEENKFRNVLHLCGKVGNFLSLYLKPDKIKCNRLKEIMSEADFMIDISGFAFSSVWEPERSIRYLTMIYLAKKFNVPVYIFPQSFGPFHYHAFFAPAVHLMAKRIMAYPKIIYAREKNGYQLLRDKYHLKNISYSPDMVLLNKSFELSYIFKTIPEFTNIKIKDNSVAILPNMRSLERCKKEDYFELYDKAINKLLELGKTIYLISHSSEDMEICRSLKSLFKTREQIVLIEEELNCIEFNNIVKQFDFLVASRYHSIVHAYKNGIPCIVLGWAVKYKELLDLFKQSGYLFNILNISDISIVTKALEDMNANYCNEAEMIKGILTDLQKKDVFSVLQVEGENRNS